MTSWTWILILRKPKCYGRLPDFIPNIVGSHKSIYRFITSRFEEPQFVWLTDWWSVLLRNLTTPNFPSNIVVMGCLSGVMQRKWRRYIESALLQTTIMHSLLPWSIHYIYICVYHICIYLRYCIFVSWDDKTCKCFHSKYALSSQSILSFANH